MEGQSILLVTFPGQGHINPSLQFAKRLLRLGFRVTLLSAFSAVNRMTKTNPALPQELSLSGFSDGCDGGVETIVDYDSYFPELERRGSKAVEEIIKSNYGKGQPFVHVIYTTLIPWVGQVAHNLNVPSTLLWAQPAAVLDIYYYYHNGYGDAFRNHGDDPLWFIDLPGLPRLTIRDLPSFVVDFSRNAFALPMFKHHVDVIEAQNNPKVLVNTFDSLELEALKAINKLNFVPVGPLLPSAFLDGKDSSDTSFGGDIFQKSKDTIEWLNSKAKGSVIYISFGSYSGLPKQMMEEIAKGLIESKRPFLWVIIGLQNDGDKEGESKVVFREEMEKQGKIVGWCSQVEVLSHPSLGCFFTHCGWNSCLETLVCGVPVVGFPLWTDQGTNSKLIEDVCGTGVRVRKNEEGIVEGSEIKRCIEIVMGSGDKGEEMRRNALKWKILAREAAKEGGSSDLNLKAFVDQEIKGTLGK